MALTSQQREVIKRCQKSAIWFMRNFVKIKHPGAGIVRFEPFDYQQEAIKSFRKYRMNIFRKTRQCFTGNTPITGPHGQTRIDSLKINDHIYSYDEYAKSIKISKVTEIYKNPPARQYRIQYGNNKQLITTAWHIFFTKRGRVPAAQLMGNDELIGCDDSGVLVSHKIHDVIDTKQGENDLPLYDLRVPPFDNYVANNTVVHNCGISKVSGVFALWFAMFSAHKTILIVSRKDDDAMSFLAENVKLPFSYLPEWMRDLWRPLKDNEHELFLPNGSKIKSLTSHPDVLRSNASSLNIIDESAFIQDMDVMWAAGRPCVRGDTLVQTDNGLIEISKLCTGPVGKFSDLDMSVSTDNGYKRTISGYNSGISQTKKIKTASGLEIECTPHHRLRIIDTAGDYVWCQASELRAGSILVTMPGTYTGQQQYLADGRPLTTNLAEIIGLYIGDGTIYGDRPKRLKIHCDKQDEDLCDYAIESLNSLGLQSIAYKEYAQTTVNCRINSAELIDLFKISNLIAKTGPHDAQIPAMIMRSPAEVACAFLRGLFEAAGTCYQTSTCFKIFFTSVSKKLAEQVQVLLHGLGVITKKSTKKPGHGHHGKLDTNIVSVSDSVSKYKFKELIGFISKRKREVLSNLSEVQNLRKLTHPVLTAEFAKAARQAIVGNETSRSCNDSRLTNMYRLARGGCVRLDLVRSLSSEFNLTDRLSNYLRRGFAFDVVVDIADSVCYTYDLSVPENNTYLANGIVSHNTLQHGGCLIGDSLLLSDNGLIKIGDLHTKLDKPWEDINLTIPTDTGIGQATKSYHNGIVPTKQITTRDGHYIEASLQHRFRVLTNDGIYDWKYVHDIIPGDQLVLSNKIHTTTHTTSPEWLTPDLSKSIGILLGNELTKPEHIIDLCVPPLILSANTNIQSAFLSGLFEANGNIGNNCITLHSTSLVLVRQIQTMLLPFGIRSHIESSGNSQYTLRTKTSRDIIRFNKSIGFAGEYKSGLLVVDDVVDQREQSCDSVRDMFVANDLFIDVVDTVVESIARTFDITEDTKNTYIANGFVSHNSVICISTTNGTGGWYWNTWTDAEAGANDFHPMMVNWWDMKWSIEYHDALSGQLVRIAPTDGIRKTMFGEFVNHERYGRIELRPDIYGKYWSPWLESQYRDLQEKGEAWKFDQEILAAFVGSGNTVVSKSVLEHIDTTVNDNYNVVTGSQVYIHPVTNSREEIDLTPHGPDEGLWIWKKPVTASPDKIMGGKIVERGRKAHTYVVGADTATGKGRDFHGLEVLDIDTMEQVAEGMFHCLPATFKKIIDMVGRWYNCALTNVERNNGGDVIIDDLNTEFAYPRLWRRSEFNGKSISLGQFGFFTSAASKATLNKFLLDFIRDKDGAGFKVYSRRLLKQLQIYVRKRDKSGRDTGKTEAESGVGNHDDLVMALALALVAVPDSNDVDATGVMPYSAQELSGVPVDLVKLQARQRELLEKGGVMMPMAFGGDDDPQESIQMELLRFASQLGGLPLAIASDGLPAVNKKKHQL